MGDYKKTLDFDKLLKKDIDLDIFRNVQHVNHMQGFNEELEQKNRELFESIARARQEEKDEKKRMNDELVEAILEAGKNGATITLGDNCSDIQIQQNAINSLQTKTLTTFDYDKALEILKEIQGYFDLPQFEKTFLSHSDSVKQIVEDTISSVESKGDVSLIKKSFSTIKVLAEGAAGSLIASGILALVSTIIK